MLLTSISFIDINRQRYNFEVDADDGIHSLFLNPVDRRRGVQSLVVNVGDCPIPEVYHLRPKDILVQTGAAS
jgi:hypothetical protein